MAYVRRRGNQLAIVHGEREPGTGQVQPRVLYIISSKEEALEILGRAGQQGRVHFEGLFQDQFPDIKVNWKKIRQGIEENLVAIPDLHEYRSERQRGRFREDLCAFTKQLILADPEVLRRRNTTAGIRVASRSKASFIRGVTESDKGRLGFSSIFVCMFFIDGYI